MLGHRRQRSRLEESSKGGWGGPERDASSPATGPYALGSGARVVTLTTDFRRSAQELATRGLPSPPSAGDSAFRPAGSRQEGFEGRRSHRSHKSPRASDRNRPRRLHQLPPRGRKRLRRVPPRLFHRALRGRPGVPRHRQPRTRRRLPGAHRLVADGLRRLRRGDRQGVARRPQQHPTVGEPAGLGASRAAGGPRSERRPGGPGAGRGRLHAQGRRPPRHPASAGAAERHAAQRQPLGLRRRAPDRRDRRGDVVETGKGWSGG